MRHNKSGRKLNRNRSHYKLMIRNMCNSLIEFEKIKTTLPKAKELQKKIEILINRSKVNSLNNRRIILSKLRNKNNTNKLFYNIGKRFLHRNGGYTRIIKYFKFRKGDNANIVYINILQ